MQMQTYICWSNKMPAKSVDENKRKMELFINALALTAR